METHDLVLDSGALSAFASGDKKLRFIARKTIQANKNIHLSAVVIAESTTGDGSRDALVNRVVRECLIIAVDERIARDAARLRAAVRSAGIAEALIMATADRVPNAILLTGDMRDQSNLAAVNAKTRVIAI